MKKKLVAKPKKKLIGRKLILNWSSEGKPDLVIELTKKVRGTEKEKALFELFGTNVVLANVYEDENGKVVDEPLGKPEGMHDGHVEGYRIERYMVENGFWRLKNDPYLK